MTITITQSNHHSLEQQITIGYGMIMQRVLGLTWRPWRMSFFVDQKQEEISKNDSNTI